MKGHVLSTHTEHRKERTMTDEEEKYIVVSDVDEMDAMGRAKVVLVLLLLLTPFVLATVSLYM